MQAVQNKPWHVLPFFNLYTMSAVLILSIASGFVAFAAAEDASGLSWLYLLGLVQFAPFAICFTRGHYNYLAFILLNHLVCFSFGKYNNVMNVTGLQKFFPHTITAMQEQIICVGLIIATYYLCRFFLFFRFIEKERYQLISLKPVPYICLMLYVFLFPIVTEYLPPALLAVHFISVNADLVLLFTSHCPQMPRLKLYAKIGAFMVCFVYFLELGSLGMMLNYLGLSFISGCLMKEHKQLVLLAMTLCLGLLVQAVKAQYRLIIYNNLNLSLTERSLVLGDLITSNPDALDEDPDDASMNEDFEQEEVVTAQAVEQTGGLGKTLLRSFDRINDDSMERVLLYTPSQVPFWEGESYASIPFMFIPRPLWPDKPTRHFWNKFGREYGYLLSDDKVTSIAVSFLAEGYMNFGYFGMYMIAIVFGFLVAAMERFSYYIAGGYFYFSFIVFLMPLLHYSSDFGSMLHALVIFGVVMYFIRPQILKVARKDEYS